MKHVTFLTTPATLSRVGPGSLNAIPGRDDEPALATADCQPAVDALAAQAS